MSVPVLLNLLNEFGYRDKMRGLQQFFLNQFNKYNNTGTQMLFSIYHMPLKLL